MMFVCATSDINGRTLWENFGWPRVQGFGWRLRRSFALLRLYWGTEDCDWSTIALVLRFQIRRTRLHVERHDLVTDAKRLARQMAIAETLLTRMIDEPYYDIANGVYGFRPASSIADLNTKDKQTQQRRKHWAKLVSDLGKQDSEMLGKIIGKYMRGWWD